LRTLAEIAEWGSATNQRRLEIIATANARRLVAAAAKHTPQPERRS